MMNLNKKIKKVAGVILFMALFFGINSFAMADAKSDATDKVYNEIKLPNLTVNYQNPLKVNSFTELVKGFLTQVQAIVGWLAVIMIVVGGIVYMTALGRSSQVELGKKILTFALLGFILAVAAPSILKEIFDLASSGKGTGTDVIKEAKPIKDVMVSVMKGIIALVGIISTIAFVITGFQFIAAGGDSGRADKARKGLIYAIIGVAVSGAALVILRQVLTLVGISS